MIVQDISTPDNVNGRSAGSFRDGQFTRYIEWRHGSVAILDSDLDGNGDPIVRHWVNDLVGANYQPLAITTTKSGIDGKLIITLGGFTPGTADSRRITLKANLTVREPWDPYPAEGA